MTDYDLSGTGIVMMDAQGAFFVSSDNTKPPSMADTVTNRIDQILTRMNENRMVKIEKSHIRAEVPLWKIEWFPNEEGFGRDYDISIELPDNPHNILNAEWYSPEEIHEWNV